jgi:serine/threonine protein kinase
VIEEEDPYKPPQVALVMKFMANGSLQDLCYHRPSHVTAFPNATKIRFCLQTAKGVLNLHRMNIIHRDLACRNLLVDDHMDVFVADFGFARLKQISSSKDQTLTRVGPVRWEAPEALEFKVYSEKTDSFSFGVCMYEIITGNEPWPRCSTSAMVILNVLKGNRMHFPINCDPVLVDVAMQCWAHSPEARPDFAAIVDKLGVRLREVDEDDREVQHEIRTIEYMISGANVLKYPFVVKDNVKGKRPQQRFVRLTSDMKSLLWRSSTANTVFSSARSKAIERGINMSDVLDVVEGQVTDNFKLFSSSNNHHANSISFSLRTQDRTVDIQCESAAERNQWVWGLRFLMSRLKPNARLQEVRLRAEETFFSDTDESLREHLTAMRYVAYWLKRGEIMIKYTSRKTHARHVCLSDDLTEILWSSAEDDGPVRKGRSKSISLNDIHNIILGVQPRLMTGSARVAAAASQLSEKLTFFRHNPVASLTASNLAHKENAHVSHRGSRPSSVETDEASFVQKAPKPLPSKKELKEHRRLSVKSIGSVEEMLRPASMSSMSPPVPSLKRNTTEDTHSSVGGSTLGSEAYHDESDYQLCVSYIGVDGRTLLALRCPNDDVLRLWSDGLAKLMSALRRSKEDTGPQYNSASDLTNSSVEAGVSTQQPMLCCEQLTIVCLSGKMVSGEGARCGGDGPSATGTPPYLCDIGGDGRGGRRRRQPAAAEGAGRTQGPGFVWL